MTAKVQEKVTTPKVVVNDVKPQILYVKRKLHKYLVNEKLQGAESTVNRPIAKELTADERKKVRSKFTNLANEMVTKYPHTTDAQQEYIVSHFKVHAERYIK